MQTRLSRYCDWVMEASWLLVVTAVPLFFNVFSSRIFEPDKISLFRSLVLLMAAAWAIKLIDTRGGEIRKELGAGNAAGEEKLQMLSRLPFLIPVLALVGASLLSTALSVDADTSLRGSYQRLQGTYTLLSYVVFFFVIVFNMRTKAQLERVVSFALLATFPIALYGLLQHNQADPLPWGGDVTFRVTSTMGNSIFLAAYLIMVVPLTLGRLAGSIRRLHAGTYRSWSIDDLLWLGAAGAAVLVQGALFIWVIFGLAGDRTFGLWWLMPLVIAVIAAIGYALTRLRREGRVFLGGLTAGYALLLGLQLLVVFYTQSRGPWLGLLAGAVVFAAFLVIRSGSKRLLAGVAAVAIVLAGFLVVFNLPGTPLDPLKEQPYIGRLGQLLETESGTGRVRVLIWGGAVEMILDNPLRTAVGYGPETMYQAYNPFYPPELAHIEARNATPDRAHNAYLDYLITTGVVGLLAYLLLLGTFALLGWRSWRAGGNGQASLVMAAIMAGLAGHLVEIAFGIPIASTQVFFWLYLALIAVVGLRLVAPQTAELQTKIPVASKKKGGRGGRKERTGDGKRLAHPVLVSWRRGYWWAYGLIVVAAIFLAVTLNVSPVRADMLFKMGMSYERAGDMQASLDYYGEAAAVAPHEDYYYLFLGRANLEMARAAQSPEERAAYLAEAERALIRARELRPLNTDHSANLGRLYSSWAQMVPDSGKQGQAVEYLTAATRLSPSNAQLRNELAMALARAGRYDEAAAQLDQSLRVDAKFSRTYLVAGDIQSMAGRAEEAAESYAEATALDPEVLGSDGQFDRRLDFLMEYGATGSLISRLSQLAAEQPPAAALHTTLGYIYARSGDPARAMEEYEVALALDPGDINNRKNLALLYRDSGRLEEAAQQVEAALRQAETRAEVSPEEAGMLESLLADLRGRMGE